MTTDQPQANPPATAPYTGSVKSVTECKLQLVRVRLQMLFCATTDASVETPHRGEIDIRGELVQQSFSATGFRATVTWQLKLPDLATSPLNITGQHELAFTCDGIDEPSARYYAEVNSVVLAHPYVRQTIDDVASKTLGRILIIPPLDVPKLVLAYLAQRRRSEQTTQGANPDAPQTTG